MRFHEKFDDEEDDDVYDDFPVPPDQRRKMSEKLLNIIIGCGLALVASQVLSLPAKKHSSEESKDVSSEMDKHIPPRQKTSPIPVPDPDAHPVMIRRIAPVPIRDHDDSEEASTN